MIDREKAIKGLKNHRDGRFHSCDDCPYVNDAGCQFKLYSDALALLEEQDGLARVVDQEHRVNDYLNGEIERLKALLKEQEAARPDLGYSGDGTTWWNICGNCRTAINPNDKFCHECGRQVKWDD